MEININLDGMTDPLEKSVAGTFVALAVLIKAVAKETNSTVALQQAITSFLAVETTPDNIIRNVARERLISIQDSF